MQQIPVHTDVHIEKTQDIQMDDYCKRTFDLSYFIEFSSCCKLCHTSHVYPYMYIHIHIYIHIYICLDASAYLHLYTYTDSKQENRTHLS